MKNTTERRVLAAAKWAIRDIERHGLTESNMRTILYAFDCDGVMDTLYYDNVKKRWSHIEYEVGKGDGAFVFMDSGYYNKTETRTILL